MNLDQIKPVNHSLNSEEPEPEAEQPNPDSDEEPVAVKIGSCCHMTRFYARSSFTDVKRNKCHYSLAFCAVYTVVLSTLVVNTIIDKGPVLFMSLAEQ